jgi:hypothetical protein
LRPPADWLTWGNQRLRGISWFVKFGLVLGSQGLLGFLLGWSNGLLRFSIHIGLKGWADKWFVFLQKVGSTMVADCKLF